MITVGGVRIDVIDAHVHVFPDEFRSLRERLCRRDAWFGELYSNPKVRLASVDDLLASMDESGVDFSILCGFPFGSSELCAEHNEYMRDAVSRFPDKLAWLGIVVPGAPDSYAMAESCFADGASGLGELNADAQGFSWSDSERLMPVVQAALAAERPVMIHTSEPVGHSYPGKGRAWPDQIASFASTFPLLKLVCAHWGGGLPFYELMPKVRPLLINVAYDSAATTYLYDHSIFSVVADIAGTDKVLFASDYPVLGQSRLVRRMESMHWHSLADANAVMNQNARRIYQLDVRS
jgi:predicted TIM-barrel fold metal-dependent hydrolase